MIQDRKTPPLKTVVFICAGLLLQSLTSCVKTSDSDEVTPSAALLTVFQASPDEPPLNFSLNSVQVGQNGIAFEQGIDYVTVAVEALTATFVTTKTDSTIASSSITLAPNKAYSLFLENIRANAGILLLTDSLTNPGANNTGVRFVDLSPDAPAVSLVIQGGKTLVTGSAFKGYTTFLPIAGGVSYTFNVVNTSTGAVLATLPNVTLPKASDYSILLEGLNTPANSTDGLKMILITNANFD
jgi:hypothetical protein